MHIRPQGMPAGTECSADSLLRSSRRGNEVEATPPDSRSSALVAVLWIPEPRGPDFLTVGPELAAGRKFIVGFPGPAAIYLETMRSDLELLQDYARNQSEDSFSALVNRHLNLVYRRLCARCGRRNSPRR